MIAEDLNLKTKVKISGAEYPFELYTIQQGSIKEIKFDNKIYHVESEDKTVDETEQQTIDQSEHKREHQSAFESKDRTVDETEDQSTNKKIGRLTEWTDEKNQYIIENYGKIPTEDIAEHFGKTSKVINARAVLLGIANDPRGGSRKDKEKVPNNTMLFLNWLEKRKSTSFTVGDVAIELSISKEKALEIVQHQITLGKLNQLGKWEFKERKNE